MKRLMLFLALAILLAVIGCNTDPRESVTGPAMSEAHAAAGSQKLDVKAWVKRDPKFGMITDFRQPADGLSPGTGWKLETVTVWVIGDKGAPQGMYRLLYIADWVRGSMYGPPGPGHCWEDGEGCTPGRWERYVTSYMPQGDPDATGDQMGDPDADELGDPDGSGISSGDPTSDDSNADGDGTVVR